MNRFKFNRIYVKCFVLESNRRSDTLHRYTRSKIKQLYIFKEKFPIQPENNQQNVNIPVLLEMQFDCSATTITIDTNNRFQNATS